MEFGKALEAMKADKKVRLPELPEGWWICIGDHSWGGGPILYRDFVLVKGNRNEWEHLKLIPRIILSEDWEIVEYIQKVKIQTSVSETYTCPICGQLDEYWPSYKENEWFRCSKCGKKLKAEMETDQEVLNYLRVELNRKFEVIDSSHVKTSLSTL